LYTAHLTPFLQQASTELDAKLQTTQQDNVQIMQEIDAQRAEIEQLVAGLENVVAGIEGSIEAMNAGNPNGLAGLKNDSWQMEQEVAATR
jgi:kinetochore protein NNF1